MSEPATPPPTSSTPLIVGVVGLAVVVSAVFLGLALRTSAPDRTATPDELASAFAQAFPSAVPAAGTISHDGDIQRYLLDRPSTAHLIPGTPAEQRLDPATAASVVGLPAADLDRSGLRDGYARAWIDDQGDHVTAEVYRFAAADQAHDMTDALLAAYRKALRSNPSTLAGYDRGGALMGTTKAKTGLITTVGIGQVGEMATVIVADQPTPARLETLADLMVTERVDL